MSIRYEGPKGGSGMREMLAVTEPIAALRDGDMIIFDVAARRLGVELPDEELRARLKS